MIVLKDFPTCNAFHGVKNEYQHFCIDYELLARKGYKQWNSRFSQLEASTSSGRADAVGILQTILQVML